MWRGSLLGKENIKRGKGRGGEERGREGRAWPLGIGTAEEKREAEKEAGWGGEEMGGRQGSLKSEPSECAGGGAIVATAEDRAYQNPKGKPVQMSEN